MNNSNLDQLDKIEAQLNEDEIAKKATIAYYDRQIEKLDAEHTAALEARQYPDENQKQVYQRVAENMMMINEYQRKRAALVSARADIVGVSTQVQKFLETARTNPNRKREPLDFSKLDVDAGTTAVDDSLNPLGGKKV